MIVQHETKLDIILSYNYDPEKDRINIATCSINKGADTKGRILA